MINKINENTNTAKNQNVIAPGFPNNEFEATKYAKDFIAKYDLPTNAEISFDPPTKKITVIWRGDENMDIFRQKYPSPFHRDNWLSCPVEKVRFEFSEDQSILLETVYFGRTGWGKQFDSPNFLIQEGTVSCENDNLAIHIIRDLEEADFPSSHERYDW